MSLGIDVYQRYNIITNWSALVSDGVEFVWVKLTDGGGPAAEPGDAYVNAARTSGLAVGGYHFAESSPTPEVQASTFIAELRRLNALEIAPMLDLEGSIADPENFRVRFWQQFRQELFTSKVVTYASKSWWTSSLEDASAIPGEMVWVADYGTNDGTDQGTTLAYWDIHQYTSNGNLNGVASKIDLNNVKTDPRISVMGILQPDDITAVANAVWNSEYKTLDPTAPDQSAKPMWVWCVGANMAGWDAVTDIQNEQASLLSAIKGVAAGQVDVQALASALVPLLAPADASALVAALKAKLDG